MLRKASLLIAATVVLTAACGGASSSAPKRKVVGVTLLTQTHAFYKELEAGIRDAAVRNNLDVIVVACETDPTKQASQIEDFVAQHVAAILAAPCDSNAVVTSLAGAEKAGIPVFTADIAAHGGKIVAHVASDNVQGGRLAADALAEYMGGKGKVLIINHPTVASVQDRVSGFLEQLKKYPGMSVAANMSADGKRELATKVMEDMLQSNPDIKGVFGINDDCALGAAGVIEKAKRTDIAVIGFDASDEAQTAIKKGGPLKADVVQYPRKIGETVVDLIAKHLAGGQVPALVATEVGLVDARTLKK